jgi:lipoate-protein ligase B
MPALSPIAAMHAPERAAGPQRLAAPLPGAAARACVYEDLGRIEYGAAWNLQRELVSSRKQGSAEDCLLFAEHPHVITMGRAAS